MLASNNILSPASGEPIVVPTQDVILGIYYLSRERINATGEGMVFSNINQAILAYEMRQVALHAKIKVRIDVLSDDGSTSQKLVDTTIGRAIIRKAVGKEIEFEYMNLDMTKKNVSKLIDISYRRLGLKKTVVMADTLMNLGFKYSTKAAISFCADDMVIPEDKATILDESYKQVEQIQNECTEGIITNKERYSKIVDIWTKTSDDVAESMMNKIKYQTVKAKNGKLQKNKSFNSIYMMSDSGARGSATQIRQLAGMRGLMTKPDGSIIESPITANFREGLDVLQYFNSTHGARKGLADTALKTANSGYLTRRLVDVAQDLVVLADDCGTKESFTMNPLIDGGSVISTLSERVLGRVLAESIKNKKGEVVLEKGTMFDESNVELLSTNSIESVKIRSPLNCQLSRGVCSKCYGRDLGRGSLVSIGEAVGIIAAQSIGEPGTQLTMRTFHIGGAASGSAKSSSVSVIHDGSVHFHNAKQVKNSQGKNIIVSRSSEVSLIDKEGRECERYKLPYGAILYVKNRQKIKSGTMVASWDPHTHPFITEIAGKVVFEDFIDGVNVITNHDEVKGESSIMVKETSKTSLRPFIRLVDEKNNPICFPDSQTPVQYYLQQNSIVLVEDGDKVSVGDTIARLSQETSGTKDITGGLPRVADLFEARSPSDAAVLANSSGLMSFGRDTRTKKRIVITDNNGSTTEQLVHKYRSLTVFEGERVEKGEVLAEGPLNGHDILRTRGVEALSDFMINEIQDVYRLQGVKINEKHIECILLQMLRKAEVTASCDSHFVQGEQVNYSEIADVNNKLVAEGKEPAKFQRLLMGITKSSLATDSFISAASFQETTRVLAEAAIMNKTDNLLGLKENVIIGRLIPAGTGYMEKLEQEQLLQQLKEQRQAEAEKNAIDEDFFQDDETPQSDEDIESADHLPKVESSMEVSAQVTEQTNTNDKNEVSKVDEVSTSSIESTENSDGK